jgi:hypothetical protein
VILLGAGATVAALPNGDANGLKSPVMANFVDVLGLGPLLAASGIKADREDFESLYSDLQADPKYAGTVAELEEYVRNYFSKFALPRTPTLYDYLLLSLLVHRLRV